MAQRTRRRRRSWSRILLLAVFAAAALYAAYFCLFRPPEVPAEETVPAEDADEPAGEETPQEDPEALARAAHLERKDYFYTILLSGSDDGNGNSDTNILLGVDAENGRIHGVSIPRDTKPSGTAKTTRSTPPSAAAAWRSWRTSWESSWASPWTSPWPWI